MHIDFTSKNSAVVFLVVAAVTFFSTAISGHFDATMTTRLWELFGGAWSGLILAMNLGSRSPNVPNPPQV
jgi:peptidoglycan/LPS O-acetylase OafA/YrhL